MKNNTSIFGSVTKTLAALVGAATGQACYMPPMTQEAPTHVTPQVDTQNEAHQESAPIPRITNQHTVAITDRNELYAVLEQLMIQTTHGTEYIPSNLKIMLDDQAMTDINEQRKQNQKYLAERREELCVLELRALADPSSITPKTLESFRADVRTLAQEVDQKLYLSDYHALYRADSILEGLQTLILLAERGTIKVVVESYDHKDYGKVYHLVFTDERSATELDGTIDCELLNNLPGTDELSGEDKMRALVDKGLVFTYTGSTLDIKITPDGKNMEVRGKSAELIVQDPPDRETPPIRFNTAGFIRPETYVDSYSDNTLLSDNLHVCSWGSGMNVPTPQELAAFKEALATKIEAVVQKYLPQNE